jgi:hypothetical protein
MGTWESANSKHEIMRSETWMLRDGKLRGKIGKRQI